MQRIPEPELMNELQQARAYARADFSEPHDHFISLFREAFAAIPPNAVVLDLGCGPADISRRFARAFPEGVIHGVDGAANMLALGNEANGEAGLTDRIELIQKYLPCTSLPYDSYDIIISNSLLHHLADPDVLWQSILQFGRAGTAVFVMDLLRPPSKQLVQHYVERYAGNEPAVLREDFYASLCAAYTEEEINMQLDKAGMSQLQTRVVSDRHLIVYGYLL